MRTYHRKTNRPYRALQWDEWLNAAAEYKTLYGDLLVPSAYRTPDGYKLGRWIERQRAMYNGKLASSLDAPRIAALEQLGMVWKLEYRCSWQEWMEQVRLYAEVHGDLLVPKAYRSGHYCLGYWIAEQKQKYTQGLLSQKEIADLESFGMQWPDHERRLWNEWYADAAAYRREKGDLLVPVGYETPAGDKLGVWINAQRERYAGKKHRPALTKAQIRRLNELDMVWDLSDVRNRNWDEMYAFTQAYVKDNGTLPVWPRLITAPNGKNLYDWVRTQRTRLSENKCPPGQREKLNRIGICAWGEAQGS